MYWKVVRSLLACALAVLAAAPAAAGDAVPRCEDVALVGVHCSPGLGRQTEGGGDKVSHRGWPAISGLLLVADHGGRRILGGGLNDEVLGGHGSDTLSGRGGADVLWGDQWPTGNDTWQRDVLYGGPGNDWLYTSHGANRVRGGSGADTVYAYYGHGTIDCGSGRDTAHVRLNGAYRVRGCERVAHFCAYGSDGHGGCRKFGEARAARRS